MALYERRDKETVVSNSDLTPARLRALADEWLMLDLQGSMTEAEMVRYDKLPLLMATALKGAADWRAGLESDISGEVECTPEELCEAVDAGADQADIDRLNRAVWTLFDRASALRLGGRAVGGVVMTAADLTCALAARVIELEAEVERLRGAAWCLRELAAMVRGECPSLLDGDRGGNGEFGVQLYAALAALREMGGPTPPEARP